MYRMRVTTLSIILWTIQTYYRWSQAYSSVTKSLLETFCKRGKMPFPIISPTSLFVQKLPVTLKNSFAHSLAFDLHWLMFAYLFYYHSLTGINIFTGVRPVLAEYHFSPVHCDVIFHSLTC